jgi:hypothetical protein
MAHKIPDDWDSIVSLLPANWEQLAIDHKQLLVQHSNAKITNAGDLLRLILVHAAADLPLRQSVALVGEAGGPSLSPMRLHKKMIRAGGYLHALVNALVDMPMDLAPEKSASSIVSAVDATVTSRSGSVNGDARISHPVAARRPEVFADGVHWRRRGRDVLCLALPRAAA